ncbi:MAG TPA: FlgD immunoglobulin-like domain containing protein [Candidatus Bathyarchaeia archaeon]|nr:FlgD immunoglobulin-like domain containing protein [Candidatus Bathyarchaeia archaeon]
MKTKTWLPWFTLVLILVAPLSAREAGSSKPPAREAPRLAAPLPGTADLRALYDAAAVDTYCTVWYDFETMDWQGWQRWDNTAQRGTFWHVDDFAGLGGGNSGKLVPIEGTKSMWCGARPASGAGYMCSWKSAPGYGNGWVQPLETYGFHFTGFVRLSYHLVVDSEPGHDILKVQIGTNWSDLCWCADFVDVTSFSGRVDTVLTHTFHLNEAGTQIRFIFSSDTEGSDEDGLWDTDGAAILDSITVADSTGVLFFENCESRTVGATVAGPWGGMMSMPYGKYSGLRGNLIDRDPCGMNLNTQIVFFVGSTEPSTVDPGLYNTPYCNTDSNYPTTCQSEMVYSPAIDLRRYSTGCNKTQNATIPSGDLALIGRTLLRFDAYQDASRSNLVFGTWFVRNIKSGCPGVWSTKGPLAKPSGLGYETDTVDITDLVSSDSIQVAVGVVDLCNVWYPLGGDCGEHTPAPWYDNVRVQRVKAPGPQWTYYDYNFFQDNFPGQESDMESYIRADAAIDINPPSDPLIRPGDSAVVGCYSKLGGGIATDAGGGPSVYLHVKCTYSGPRPAKPNLAGAELTGNVGRYKSDDGVWTILQCDTARTAAGVARNRYAVDLNDSLFTRGYVIEYYFTARDSAGVETALPGWARSGGPYFEFTCLPRGYSDILFVDDSGTWGPAQGAAESYWTSAFKAAISPPSCDVDIYHVNGATSGVSNGPGSRAKIQHLRQYDVIVWDSGNLDGNTISDGTAASDKSNDCGMLIDWMNLTTHMTGLWVCGDNTASDLTRDGSTVALTLMDTWCGVSLVNDSYFTLTGGLAGSGIINPLITGDADFGLFIHCGIPDKFYLEGGCPLINSFDALGKTAYGHYALRYPQYQGHDYYAGVASYRTNSLGQDVRTLWFGFSFQFVRDDQRSAPLDRFELVGDVIAWMQTGPTQVDITPAEAPRAYRLAQNYPNPFNPSTTIRYDMKEKGTVTLKIYNVAGELVRTLANDVRDAGSYSVTWDGSDDRGIPVASGIYFSRMQAGGFVGVKKVVLLR